MHRATCLAAALLIATPAWAGLVISLEQTGPDGAKRPTQMLVEPDRLRMQQPPGAMIYRADQDKTWTVDDNRKTYMEMTRQSLTEMRGQMEAAMAQARAQIANLPPEQRKVVEEMMAKQGGAGMMNPPAAAPTVTYEKAGPRKTVGRWACEPYSRLENGRKAGEQCIARMSDLGVTRDDLKAFRALSEMMRSAAGPQRAGADMFDFDTMAKAVGFEGLPVYSTHILPDGRVLESTVTGIERQALSPAQFELPAGYTKQEMPRAPGPPR